MDRHNSQEQLKFHELCKENNIYALCMPSHASHLLQPLDVGCFSPLKTAYGNQVSHLMRSRINHITKLEFLPAFKAAFDETITEKNICASFRAAGIVPLNAEEVLSKISLHLHTPTPPPQEEPPWQSQTPSNARELQAQSTLLREKIRRRVSSTPPSIDDVIQRLTKSAEKMMHQAELLRDEVAALQRSNEAATKRRSRKKKRIQKQGSLTIAAGVELIAQQEAAQKGGGKKPQEAGGSGVSRQALARCTRCREPGHN